LTGIIFAMVIKIDNMYKTLLLSFLIIVVATSCKKENLDEVNQPVDFEFEYINHAWVYTHQGWMVDEEGNVRGFNLPVKWNHPDESNYITKAELTENLAQADSLYTTADEANLTHHFKNRFDMQGAVMDTSDVFMADAGVGALYVYVWNDEVDKYEKVHLASRGDTSVTNTSNEAKAAVNWLITIGKQTDRFFWFEQ